jgi:hypothetical protein
MRRPPLGQKSRGALEDLVLLLEPLHLPPEPRQLGGFSLLPRQGLGGADRQLLVAPRPELVGMDAEIVGDRLQGLAALLEPVDRLDLVLCREPAPLPLLHPPFPVLVNPNLAEVSTQSGQAHRAGSARRCGPCSSWPKSHR